MFPYRVEETPICGLLVIHTPHPPADVRGELWSPFRADADHYLVRRHRIAQFNVVDNHLGATRGIHAEPWDKYVTVSRGSAVAIIKDLRKGSRTYGQFERIELNTTKALFVARGLGNSVQVLEEGTQYVYLTSKLWKPGIRYQALTLMGAPFPLPREQWQISTKDLHEVPQTLEEYEELFSAPERVLITGAFGQVGRELVREFGDALTPTRAELDLSWSAERIYTAVMEMRPTLVLHAGAWTDVDGAERNASASLAINQRATEAIARACRDSDARIIYYSSDYVARSEDELPRPQSVYAYGKWGGEMAVREYCPLTSTIIRLSYVFGEGVNFPRTMLAQRGKRSEVHVVHDQVIRPTYAPHIASATAQLVREYGVGGGWLLPQLLHMQNDGPAVPMDEYAAFIFDAASAGIEVCPITFAEYTVVNESKGRIIAERPLDSVFDLSLLTSLGVHMPTWQEAVREFVARELAAV